MRKHWLLGTVLLLFTGLASLASVTPVFGDEKLALSTEYLFQRIELSDRSMGAHLIHLQVTLGEKGGKGQITLDPNINDFDAFGDVAGSTEIGYHPIEIMLSPVAKEDPAKKGRRLFEIHGVGGQGRLFLVVPPEKTGAHRLLVATKDGTVKHVFSLHQIVKAK